MITSFSKILLEQSPKKINKSSNDIIDILFNINEFLREINSIDFCNPLGYILTKALPPGSILETEINKLNNKVNNFLNKYNLNSGIGDISDDLESIRLDLEELIIPESLLKILPSGKDINKIIFTLNDSIVITNTIISLDDKKILLKNFTNKILIFTNPVTIAEILFNNSADKLNNSLRKLIKPEQFINELLKLIRFVKKLDKSIFQIQNILLLINKIIKAIKVLIKIYKLINNTKKFNPAPAMYSTVGVIVKESDNVSDNNKLIDELEKLLKNISAYIDNVLILNLLKIRKEIFITLVNLNQLLENIKQCSYLNKNESLLNNINQSLVSLNNSITLLDNLLPQENIINNNSKLYKNYKINIIKEETTDNNTSLFRKRLIITNENDLLEYESTPTFANDKILIKEGELYIDFINNNESEDIESNNELINLGYDSDINQLINTYNNNNNELNNRFKKDPLFQTQSLQNNSNKIIFINKLINNIRKNSNPKLINIRLNRLNQSLIKKGYTQEEINQAYKL